MAKLEQKSAIVRFLFQITLKCRLSYLAHAQQSDSNVNLASSFITNAIFSAIKANTGGRLRYALSGGAPISEDTQNFLTATLCPIIQGFGLTETCGLSFLLLPNRWKPSVAGEIAPCCEALLVSEPELGYSVTDDPPRGELWLRGNVVFFSLDSSCAGPSVSREYYHDDKNTKENFEPDGWFKTGDICRLTKGGMLQVFDRKKNLVKLSSGEYISAEKLQMAYGATQFTGSVCAVANTHKDCFIMLAEPNEPNIRNFLRSAEGPLKGLAGESLKSLVENPAVKDYIFQQMLSAGAAAKLRGAEVIRGLFITPEIWSADNGLLTAANKVRAGELNKRYKSEIDAIFAKL